VTRTTDLSEEDQELEMPMTASNQKAFEEEQTRVARDHPLYNTSPDENGLYKCPYTGKPQCNHKPTKLKCNYE
jgi:hypothetical protein